MSASRCRLLSGAGNAVHTFGDKEFIELLIEWMLSASLWELRWVNAEAEIKSEDGTTIRASIEFGFRRVSENTIRVARFAGDLEGEASFSLEQNGVQTFAALAVEQAISNAKRRAGKR